MKKTLQDDLSIFNKEGYPDPTSFHAILNIGESANNRSASKRRVRKKEHLYMDYRRYFPRREDSQSS